MNVFESAALLVPSRNPSLVQLMLQSGSHLRSASTSNVNTHTRSLSHIRVDNVDSWGFSRGILVQPHLRCLIFIDYREDAIGELVNSILELCKVVSETVD
jgi:hypothetical protein